MANALRRIMWSPARGEARAIAVAAAIGVVMLYGVATGQSAAEAPAQALFDEGSALLKKGDYAGAAAKLAESQRLEPAFGTLVKLAKAYDKLGKTASAWAA